MLSWLNLNQRVFKNFNYLLMIQLIPIFIMSSLLVFEINPELFKKQMIYYVVALMAFIIFAIIPWRLIFWWLVPTLYGFNLLLLLLVDVAGKTILGAQRWLEIPGIGLTIQPSEFIKVSIVMTLAYMIRKTPPPKEGYSWIAFLKFSILIIIPFLLVAKEPDLGTAVITLIVGFGILFVVGVKKEIWISLIILMSLSAPLVYKYGLKTYQKQRIYDMVNQPSYQVRQALIAIGSGGFTGQAKEESTQTQLKFLPISSSDFIFAYLGERFGFLGMMTIITLYVLLILHLFYIGIQPFTDYYIKVFAIGLSLIFFVYMSVNIYMIIGLAPVVGVPLPMFSHGGTSFIIFAVLLGILQNLIAFQNYLGYNSDAKVSLAI
ncbi:MAG: FtsW/RodA/SpoVE family cell cycle protein [Sulfurovaceae bacterium]|nr:FtsW/RodA/SpoVE family cell cycle protein [Sulfurovaceae bacterium]MDD5548797.1 FtsW/RodA/SpoVE family cell cycle protein [Sulfurovaceae bacterium]